MSILVTGGAGFIGSHLIDRLIADGNEVVCVDDLSLGREKNIEHLLSNAAFKFYEQDILDGAKLDAVFGAHGFDCVFHMAANSDIQAGAKNPEVDYEKTFMTTYRTLDAMARHGVREIVFASTSAVYGENYDLLTEETGPLQPISFYGAGKLASEAFITAYGENRGIAAWIFRFPNVVGARATHGVIFDFLKKLEMDRERLEVLGDGTQEKPYLHVKDLVDAMVFGWKESKGKLNVFNVGVDSATKVSTIARMTVEELGFEGVRIDYTGGDRGWVGDVPKFSYDTSKIESLGWRPKMTSDEAVRLSIREIIAGKESKESKASKVNT